MYLYRLHGTIIGVVNAKFTNFQANDFYAKCRLGDAGVRIDFLICPDNAYYYTDAVQRFDRQGNRGF